MANTHPSATPKDKPRYYHKFRLRIRVTLFIVFVITVLLIGIVGVNYKASESLVINILNQNANAQLQTHQQYLANWMKSRKDEIKAMATNQAFLSGENDKTISGYLKEEKKRALGVYLSFSFTDVKGNSYTDNDIYSNVSNEKWFSRSLQGEMYISRPTPSITNPNNLTVLFSTPVYNQKHEIIGVLSGSSLINTVFKETTDFKVGKKDITYLVDQKGNMIFYPEKSKILQYNLLQQHSNEKETFISSLLKEKKGYQDIKVNNETHTIFSIPVEGTNWFLILEVPKKEFVDSLHHVTQTNLISVIIAVVLIGLSVFFILNGIFKRLKRISHVANSISNGDLNISFVETKRNDEIGIVGHAVSKMLDNLKHIFEQINREVASSASAVTESSQKLSLNAEETMTSTKKVIHMIEQASKGTEEQVETVESNSSLMQEMTLGIKQIAQSSTEVSDNAKDTADKALKGNQSISDSIEQMNTIREVTNASSMVIGELRNRSSEIGNIVEVINGLTSQINLLALNAEIEAARAGEHGRGFKVVAEEVKKLADQTAESANQISGLIEQTQNDVMLTEEMIKKVNSEVERGTVVTKEAGHSFQDILESVKHVNEQIYEVSSVSEELLANSEEVQRSFETLIETAKETSLNFHSVSSASEEQFSSMQSVAEYAEDLAKMAHNLQELIKEMNT